ncbi:hypothetical protein HYX10_06240 [Candidatus Woesearchaeota archaeon]|nr:hypothetical protein [Candidatus Woesearchaeota archaeon]
MGFSEHKYLAVVLVAALAFYFLFVHGRLYGEINGSFISYGTVWKGSFIPFWTPLLSGGHPLYSQPEIPLFGILNFLMLIVPDIVLAFSLSVLAHLVIAGVGAALLAKEFSGSRHAAVVSGIAYMFIGTFAYATFSGILPHLYPLAFFPWIMLFAFKATKANLLRNSLIAAAFSAFQLISGGTIYFLWSFLGIGVFLGMYFLFSLLRLQRKEMAKIAAIGVVLIIFTLGFSAVKLMPSMDFNKLSNRADSVGYEEYIWRFTHITASQIPSKMFGAGVSSMRVGVVVTLLAAASLLTWRRKYVLALGVMAAVSLLVEIETPLTKLIHHLPGFDKTRQIYHALAPFSLGIAVLAGVGSANIVRKFKTQNIVTAVVILLILAELFAIGYDITKQPFEKNYGQQIEDNQLLQHISRDEDYFRMHVYGEDFVGLSLAKYAVPLDIRLLDWTTSNIWFNDYVQFTAIAGQQNSAKMWGMANVKYVASRENISVPGLAFVKKFEECSLCDLKGSYLYQNELFLPEAYVVRNATLVIGDEAGSFGNTYAVILDPFFDSSRNAVVNLPEVPDDVNDYDMVLLTSGALSQEDVQMLFSFASAGKIIQPNIANGSNQVDLALMRQFFGSAETVSEARIVEYQPTRVEVEAAASGLLVLSEKFYKFREWEVKVNGEKAEKLKANLISTGLLVEKGDIVTFEYVPKAFYRGLAVTALSIIAAAALIFHRFFFSLIKLRGGKKRGGIDKVGGQL